MSRKPSRRSFGSITEISRGRKYICRWWEDTERGYARKSKTIHGTRSDASKFLAERELRKDRRGRVPTVGELWEQFKSPALREDVRSGRTAEKTEIIFRSKWKNYVAPRWACVPCTKVRTLDVQNWLEGLTKSTGMQAKTVLKLTLDYAVLYEIIPSNPAAKTFRYGPDTAKQKSIFTLKELDEVAPVIHGTACWIPFILSSRAGLRVGEACGVKLSSVEFRDGVAVITVTHQLTQTGKVTSALKTKKSARVVAVPEPWAGEIKKHMDSLPPDAVYLNDDGTGNPIPRWAVNRAWGDALKPSGIRYLPMQVLRPSYETYMHHLAGIPIEQVARSMGHTTPATTLAHYDRPGVAEAVKIAQDASRHLVNWDI